MLHILLGSLALSLVHAAIPNHWLPLVAVSKAQRWSHSQALAVTALTGTAHAASTILIGVLVGVLGYSLSSKETLTWLLPGLLLIALGVAYLILDRRGRHSHEHFPQDVARTPTAPTVSIVLSLAAAMFFSPCIEVEAYYLQGGALGWPGIVAISVVYLIVTVSGMVLLVHLGLHGARHIRSEFLEHHERKATGYVLIALGLLTFFVGF